MGKEADNDIHLFTDIYDAAWKQVLGRYDRVN